MGLTCRYCNFALRPAWRDLPGWPERLQELARDCGAGPPPPEMMRPCALR